MKKLSHILSMLRVLCFLILVPVTIALGTPTFNSKDWTVGFGVGTTVTYQWFRVDQPCCPQTIYTLEDGSSMDVTAMLKTNDTLSIKILDITETQILYNRTFSGQNNAYTFTTQPQWIDRGEIDLTGPELAHPVTTTNTTALQKQFGSDFLLGSTTFTIQNVEAFPDWPANHTYDRTTGILLQYYLIQRTTNQHYNLTVIMQNVIEPDTTSSNANFNVSLLEVVLLLAVISLIYPRRRIG